MPQCPTNKITYIARTNHRNTMIAFGMRCKDRMSHVYIIGKTGTGKSTLLRRVMAQDIGSGHGFALFDPHGDLAEAVHNCIPPSRIHDVTYLNLSDSGQIWHFNPFADIDPAERSLAAAGIVEVFKKIWIDDWGPRLEHLLRNVVYALLECPGSTFGDIPRLLSDKTYRSSVLEHVTNPTVRSFWENEYTKYSAAFRAVVIAPLQNKLGALLTDPLLHRIFTGDRSTVDVRAVMNEGRILLVNLDRGRIGEGPATIIGSFLVSHIALAGLSRSNMPESARREFYVFLDEFQTFATHTLTTMLSELRKYRVGMMLAHQHLGQLDPDIRDSVFGNAGTVISFRLGAQDAAFIAREMSPVFGPDDFINLPNYRMYLRLLIDGEPSKPFSASTIAPSEDL